HRFSSSTWPMDSPSSPCYNSRRTKKKTRDAVVERETSATARLIQRVRGFRYALVWEGIAVGAAAGLVTVLFRLLLSKGDLLRAWIGDLIADKPWLLPLWLLLLGVAAGVVTLLLKWESF